MKEAEWQQTVITLAGYYRWRHFHPYEMRRSDPGWPDLVLVRPGQMIFAELKSQRGVLTPAQREWGRLLTSVAMLAPALVGYYVWKPSQIDDVHELLKTGPTG